MAKKKVDRKANYKFAMSKYVIECKTGDRWVYDTQVQRLTAAKKIADKFNEKRKGCFRVYDNVLGVVVYPLIEVQDEA